MYSSDNTNLTIQVCWSVSLNDNEGDILFAGKFWLHNHFISFHFILLLFYFFSLLKDKYHSFSLYSIPFHSSLAPISSHSFHTLVSIISSFFHSIQFIPTSFHFILFLSTPFHSFPLMEEENHSFLIHSISSHSFQFLHIPHSQFNHDKNRLVIACHWLPNPLFLGVGEFGEMKCAILWPFLVHSINF